MAGVGAISIQQWCSSPSTTTKTSSFIFKLGFLGPVNFCRKQSSPFNIRRSHNLDRLPFFHNHITPRAASSSSSVGTTEYIEEPATKVKFQTSITLPGSSTSLALLGTGYREKVFAIIGVKVYAAGLYVDQSIFLQLQAWRGRSATEVQQDGGLFDTIFQAPLEKSLQIVLVRDVDGKTFWDALDEVITPRMSSPTPDDKSALATFRSIFQGRALKKQTFIFLTWINPTKMLVSVSSDGLPSSVDATIESVNVTSALFNVFLGDGPVSPSLKISVAEGLSTALMQKA